MRSQNKNCESVFVRVRHSTRKPPLPLSLNKKLSGRAHGCRAYACNRCACSLCARITTDWQPCRAAFGVVRASCARVMIQNGERRLSVMSRAGSVVSDWGKAIGRLLTRSAARLGAPRRRHYPLTTTGRAHNPASSAQRFSRLRAQKSCTR